MFAAHPCGCFYILNKTHTHTHTHAFASIMATLLTRAVAAQKWWFGLPSDVSASAGAVAGAFVANCVVAQRADKTDS